MLLMLVCVSLCTWTGLLKAGLCTASSSSSERVSENRSLTTRYSPPPCSYRMSSSASYTSSICHGVSDPRPFLLGSSDRMDGDEKDKKKRLHYNRDREDDERLSKKKSRLFSEEPSSSSSRLSSQEDLRRACATRRRDRRGRHLPSTDRSEERHKSSIQLDSYQTRIYLTMDCPNIPLNLRRRYLHSLCVRYEEQQRQMCRQREEDISRLEHLLLLSRRPQQKQLQLLQDHSSSKEETDLCKTGWFFSNDVEVPCSLSSCSGKKTKHEVEIKDDHGEDGERENRRERGRRSWRNRREEETDSLSQEEEEEISLLQTRDDEDVLLQLLPKEEELREEDGKTIRRENRKKDSVVREKVKSSTSGEQYNNERERKEKKEKSKSSRSKVSDNHRVPGDSSRDGERLEEEDDRDNVCQLALETQGASDDIEKYQDLEGREDNGEEEEGERRAEGEKEDRRIIAPEEDGEKGSNHSSFSFSPCAISSSSCRMMICSSEPVLTKSEDSGGATSEVAFSRHEQERCSFLHQRSVFRSSLPLQERPRHPPVEKKCCRRESDKNAKEKKRSRLLQRHELSVACCSSSSSSSSAKTLAPQTAPGNISATSLRNGREREEEEEIEQEEEIEENSGDEIEEEEEREKEALTYPSPSSLKSRKKSFCSQDNDDDDGEHHSALQALHRSRRGRSEGEQLMDSSFVEASSRQIDYRKSSSGRNRTRTGTTRGSHSHGEEEEEKEFKHQRNPVEVTSLLSLSFIRSSKRTEDRKTTSVDEASLP